MDRSPPRLTGSRPRDLWLMGAIVFASVTAFGLSGGPFIGNLVEIAAVLFGEFGAGFLFAFGALALSLWWFVLRWVVRRAWHDFANSFAVEAPSPVLKARVVDGDTIHDLATGERYRLANIDAPETGEGARCLAERFAGETASVVAHNLVFRARKVEVRRTFRFDQWGRRVAFVLVDGVDLGEILMKRGLARPWRGRRVRWCGPAGGFAAMAHLAKSTIDCRCGARRPYY